VVDLSASSPSEALEAFLAQIPAAGAMAVRAATARRLATAVETAPDYALARLAVALVELVDQLEAAVELEGQAKRNLSWLKKDAA
jgi:molecular chaperone GrpE (heat shock protein)